MKKKVLLSVFGLLSLLALASCSGGSDTPSTPDQEPHNDPPHVHTLSTTWSSDGTNHWHTCSGCNEKFDLGDHEVKMTKTDPTCQATGSMVYTCDICGYTNTTTIEKISHAITLVEYEEYMNQFNGKNYANGGRCDLLMFDADNHKVIFCDLGCYSEKHVEKKRMKSYQQVCDSLARFLHKPCGKTFIDQFGEKVLIFGRRDPAVDPREVHTPERGNVKGNMQAFLKNPISMPKYAISAEVVEDVNVNFVIVNYPEAYVW
jgi:hypothetical protein